MTEPTTTPASTTGDGGDPTPNPDRVRTLLADVNREEFRAFNPTQAGLVGCGVSALLLLAAPAALLVILGWSWWALAGLVVGAGLAFANAKMSDGRSYRKMARRVEARAKAAGLAFDRDRFLQAALEKPSAVALSYREVGFLHRLLRALGASDDAANRAVEAAGNERPRATLSEDEYEEALAESRRR